MLPASHDPLTVPVKPFLYQPRPAAFTLVHLLTAQAAGVICASVGWPLFFIVSMALPMTLLQRGDALPDWFGLAYSAAQFLAFGGILGLAQLWVLHRWVPFKQGWLISSGLVGLLAFPATAYLGARMALWPAGETNQLLMAAAGALGGLLLGMAQSPFLDRRRSGWRLVSTVTWAAFAPLVVFLIEHLMPVLVGR